MSDLENKYFSEKKLDEAKMLLDENKPLHALQVCISLINKVPDYKFAYIKAAQIYKMLGNIDPAVKLLNEYLDEYPEDSELRFYAGHYMLENERWNEAIDVFSYITPEEEPLSAYFLGYAYYMAEDFELSIHYFLKFLKLNKHQDFIIDSYVYLAKCYLKQSDYENALTYIKKAEGIVSHNWEVNLILAQAYTGMGMYTHAQTSILRALKIAPDEPSCCLAAGNIFFANAEYDKAESYIKKYLDNAKDAVDSSYLLYAGILYMQKKYTESIAYYDLYLSNHPEDETAKTNKMKALDEYHSTDDISGEMNI